MKSFVKIIFLHSSSLIHVYIAATQSLLILGSLRTKNAFVMTLNKL